MTPKTKDDLLREVQAAVAVDEELRRPWQVAERAEGEAAAPARPPEVLTASARYVPLPPGARPDVAAMLDLDEPPAAVTGDGGQVVVLLREVLDAVRDLAEAQRNQGEGNGPAAVSTAVTSYATLDAAVVAAGDPHEYDGPSHKRMMACARVNPLAYAELKNLRHELGLRTMAGVWEYVLRLGLAAAERRPAAR